MSSALRDLPVLVLDCQASGATPAHGDLLEIGWAMCSVTGGLGALHAYAVVPRTTRPVSRAVRELTGWSEARVAHALSEQQVWDALRETLAGGCLPTLIHFARFELRFLADLHARLAGDTPFPFDARCLHAIAARLFPDLPRRNIRALAGFLGHSTDLLRRCAGHVEASAFIWCALVPRLEELGIATWSDLARWLEDAPKATRRTRRVYPLALERRRALPDKPGVYRFLRSNRDVLYVGKAVSVKKRVANHFSASAPSHERALELLSQVQEIAVSETVSVLEAALLESDEIKRLDPPYNVQLRAGERQAWFASRDLRTAVASPDAAHRVGPLPSQGALSALAALIALADGAAASPALCAMALAVPIALLPDANMFAEGFQRFAAELLVRPEPSAARRVAAAALALFIARGRSEPEASSDEAPDDWDLARVRRRLERGLLQSGLLLRRARLLRLLAHADVAYRERGMTRARALIVAHGQLVAQHDLDCVTDIVTLPRRSQPVRERHACFDAASYDRLRVLATELSRVQHEGGDVALRFGAHAFTGQRLIALLAGV
jgi:DNA polymerase III subunit epsilon